MYAKGILIFCLVILHEPVFCYGKVAMADDPILNHLQMDPETDYEFLGKDFLHQLDKRDLHDATPVTVYTMDESIDLLLYPGNSTLATSNTPLYLVMKNLSKTGGVQYFVNWQVMRFVGKLLEDPKHLASLVINKHHHKRLTVNGVVRSKRHDANLVIRSLPDSVIQEHLRKRRSTNGSADEHLSQSQHLTNHVIMKIKDGEASKKPREELEELLGRTQIKVSSVHRNTKRDVQSGFDGTLYLKLLIHLDSTYFNETYPGYEDLVRLLGKRKELVSLMEYVLAFWNSVELPYRNLRNSTIQFHIAGIIIAPSPEATPYFANFTKNDGTIEIYSALEPAKSFYYDVRDQMLFSEYDLVVAMTKLNPSDSTAGSAETGSLCSDPTELKKQGAVVVMTDNHGFGGIHTARHEVGHAFGLKHDGELNDPRCTGEEGFIMSPVDMSTDQSGFFSPCSLEEFGEALKAEKFKCLYKRPTLQGSSLPLLAPGKILNMDQQCQARNYARACNSWTDEFCESLGCDAGKENGRRICEFFAGAAPGTPCDTGNNGKFGICFMKRCVADN